MVCGALHVYGTASTVAGTELAVAVPARKRPAEIRTAALKRAGTDALTISLVVTYNGWGPYTIVLATGIVTTEWNDELNFALPIGSTVSLTTSGIGVADTIQGVVVVEEMRQ